MKDLPDKLKAIGVERRFALDIGSVIAGIRPRGLMHIPAQQKNSLEQILIQFGLKIEAHRTLFRKNDSSSREGILLDSCDEDSATEWCEIWYTNPTATRVNSESLFLNTGEFLGYPACCRGSMTHENALDKLFNKYIFTDKNRFWEVNRLATIFHHTILMPDFFPCSLSCEAGRDFVRPFQKMSYEIFQKEEVDLAIESMKSALIIIENSIVCWSKWNAKSNGIHVAIEDAKKESLKNVSSLCHNNRLKPPAILGFTHFDWINHCDEITLHISSKEDNSIHNIYCKVE